MGAHDTVRERNVNITDKFTNEDVKHFGYILEFGKHRIANQQKER